MLEINFYGHLDEGLNPIKLIELKDANSKSRAIKLDAQTQRANCIRGRQLVVVFVVGLVISLVFFFHFR